MAVDYISAINQNGSGLNITQIVESLVEAETKPKKDNINDKIDGKNLDITAVGKLTSELNTFQTSLNSLTDVSKFKTTSGNTGTTITVDNVGKAKEFNSDINVTSLATPQTLEFTGFALPTSSIGSGNITVDFGNWIYNAGVVEPAIPGCDASTNIPSGTPTKLQPQIMPSLDKRVPTHRWWGSIPFLGEMTVGDFNDPAHVTADPIRARVSNKGARLMGLPSGYQLRGNFPQYDGPEPFAEVFDGIAIANSKYSELNAYLVDYSDGSVTVGWTTSNMTNIMWATFVHGSPYVYFTVFDGDPIIVTKAADSGEKGTFYEFDNNLGVWTDVAGIRNNFLITGEPGTTYSNIASNNITITKPNDGTAYTAFTVSYLPALEGIPGNDMVDYFASRARNQVSEVDINYSVDRSTNTVTVSHDYLDFEGNPIDTIVGMHPMHWKFSDQTTSNYKIRSARGVIKFAELSSFEYQIPFVGVLPLMPSLPNTYDQNTLEQYVQDYISGGEDSWINSTDTYWSGKAYGKAAEIAGIARSIGMDQEADQVVTWLKEHLSDWFTAETNGELDELRYFVYDEEWDTLLGIEEAFGSHQRLADHHFHYGYFVRAAAEICRQDRSWCSEDQYGPMVELLIRDYAGDPGDDMFPPLRNFDPANGFSWADGKADALQGNNNESTSEAANSYGAIILYGLITDNQDLVNKGIYLHASTSAAYWQYWNNIDGYNNLGADYDNFIPGYDKITTSIIWSAGADFSTWFSPAYAHILGIQGLPSNPLIFHVSQYKNYMEDYVTLGLSESSNGKPSGLPEDQWRDLWWNLWAMVDPESAIADYETMAPNYNTEAGESKAHTYHWLQTFNALGHIQTGTGDLTANHPAAVAFKKNDEMNYVAYNFGDAPLEVSYSDGKTFTVPANSFKVEGSTSNEDTTGPLISELDVVSENVSDNTLVFDGESVKTIKLRWRLQDPSGITFETPFGNSRILLARTDGGSGGTKSWDLDSLQSERVSGDSTDGYYEKELDLAADQHPSGEFSISLRQVGDLEGNITTMEIEEGYPLTIVNNSQ